MIFTARKPQECRQSKAVLAKLDMECPTLSAKYGSQTSL